MATKEDLKKIKPLSEKPRKSSSSNNNLNEVKPFKMQMLHEDANMPSYEYFSDNKKNDKK